MKFWTFHANWKKITRSSTSGGIPEIGDGFELLHEGNEGKEELNRRHRGNREFYIFLCFLGLLLLEFPGNESSWIRDRLEIGGNAGGKPALLGPADGCLVLRLNL